jgi:hypothetical protein
LSSIPPEILSFVSNLSVWFWAALVALGIPALVAKFVADWAVDRRKPELEKIKSELTQDVETHKWNLKKKEILFNKELEASSAFTEVLHKIMPRYRHPDMDWGQTLHEFAGDLSNVESKLRNFRTKHVFALPDGVREKLEHWIERAEAHQYGIAEGGAEGDAARKIAEEMLNALSKIEKELIQDIKRVDIRTPT